MKSTLIGLLSAGLLLSGCTTEDVVEPSGTPAAPEAGKPGNTRVWTAEENAAFMDKILDLGFRQEDIKDVGEFFLVEKDILFEKVALEAENAPLAKTAHKRSQYIVRDDKAHVLTVRVDVTARPAGGTPSSTYSWEQATIEAINAWNALGYFVKFAYTTGSTADITVRGGYQSTMEWLVAATFPTSGGAPGSQILARTDWPSSVSARKLEMAHALGHTVGLHHTNGTTSAVVGSSTRVSPYADIPSTPATETGSIMNSLPYFEDPWPAAGFSIGDGHAMRRLYSSHIKATANNPHRYAVDVTGDGRADLVTFDEDGVVVATSYGSGFSNETLWNNQYGSRAPSGGWSDVNHVRELADVNGDGRMDVVGFGQAGVYVALSNGSAFVGLPSAAYNDFHYNNGWRTNRHIRTLADVNGDGRADIVGISENDVIVATGRTDGYFNTATIWHNDFAYADGWTLVKDLPRMLGDVTGDGKADLVGFGFGNVVVGVSTGSGFVTAIWSSAPGSFVYNDGWRDAQHIRTLADVNGDGRKDIVGFSENDAVVGISTGSSFVNYLGSSLFGRLDGYDKTKTLRMMGDVTGDGRADVVAVNENEVVVGVSQGTSFSIGTWHTDFAQNDGWRVADHLRTIADVNGDGRKDFVGLGYNEGVAGISSGSGFNTALWY